MQINDKWKWRKIVFAAQIHFIAHSTKYVMCGIWYRLGQLNHATRCYLESNWNKANFYDKSKNIQAVTSIVLILNLTLTNLISISVYSARLCLEDYIWTEINLKFRLKGKWQQVLRILASANQLRRYTANTQLALKNLKSCSSYLLRLGNIYLSM